MKNILLTCLFSLLLINAFAQNGHGVDTALKFNKRFTNCELKWVVMPQKDTSGRHFYGFIYIDETAGFTFDLKGFFTIDQNGQYKADSSINKYGRHIYRLGPNTMNVALLPLSHFKEMNLQLQPAFIDVYYRGINDTSVFHNYHMGFNYNAAGDSQTALKFLDKACKANPHFKGLEFEMAYAYNALNQPDKAIAVLEAAVKYDPKNIMFYRELGYAYMNKADYDKAISYFTQGINLTPETQAPNEPKAEIAYNLASIYKKMSKDDEYKNWMVKAKGWSLPNSNIYKAAVGLGF